MSQKILSMQANGVQQWIDIPRVYRCLLGQQADDPINIIPLKGNSAGITVTWSNPMQAPPYDHLIDRERFRAEISGLQEDEIIFVHFADDKTAPEKEINQGDKTIDFYMGTGITVDTYCLEILFV